MVSVKDGDTCIRYWPALRVLAIVLDLEKFVKSRLIRRYYMHRFVVWLEACQCLILACKQISQSSVSEQHLRTLFIARPRITVGFASQTGMGEEG